MRQFDPSDVWGHPQTNPARAIASPPCTTQPAALRVPLDILVWFGALGWEREL